MSAGPYVYLFRSWRRLLQSARITKRVWIHDFAAKMRMIHVLHERLSAGRRVAPGEWEDDLPAFVTKLSAADLAALERGIRANLVPRERDAVCRMYTVHGFKGMEHARVRVAGDINVRTDASLYYVALTRGIEMIHLDPMPKTSASASASASAKTGGKASSRARGRTPALKLDAPGEALRERLRAFRTQTAKAQGIPPYRVFSNGTMDLISAARPRAMDALQEIHGVGAGTVNAYGADILRCVTSE